MIIEEGDPGSTYRNGWLRLGLNLSAALIGFFSALLFHDSLLARTIILMVGCFFLGYGSVASKQVDRIAVTAGIALTVMLIFPEHQMHTTTLLLARSLNTFWGMLVGVFILYLFRSRKKLG